MAAENPNPGRIADLTWEFWLALDALDAADEFGGIYALKPGHHSTRRDNERNWPGNYSTEGALNQGGPDDKSSAVDWTFKTAKKGDYSRIRIFSARLLAASRANDPRLRGLREWYGQADADTGVEGWSFRTNEPASSDSSHLWHIHFSFWRSYVLVAAAYAGVLSVLRGESLEAYLARGGQLIGGDEMEQLTKIIQEALKAAGFDPIRKPSNDQPHLRPGGAPGDGRRRAAARRRHHPGPGRAEELMMPQFWDRLQTFLAGRVVYNFVVVGVIAALGMSFWVSDEQQELTECVARYADAARANTALRSEAAAADRQVLDNMIYAMAEARSKEAIAIAFQNYRVERARLDGQREVAPIPPPPSETCS